MSLRDWRYAAGLSQRQLASKARVSRTTLGHIEQQRRPPSVAVAGRIVDALCRELGLRLETWHIFPQVFHAPEELLEQSVSSQREWQ